MPHPLVGIDIGTTTVTTVVASQEKSGKLRIVASGSAPSSGMRRGAVVDVEAASRVLKRSLTDAGRAARTPIRNVFVAVGGTHLNAFPIRGAIAVSRADGEITEDDVHRVVRAAEAQMPQNPNREVVHLIPREFKVDGAGGITDPVGMAGMKLEVEALVIDGAKPALQNLIKCCELAGVTIDDWTASMLASSEILLTQTHRELGAMLLDLGGGTSDFVVFEEGKPLDIGTFPIGGSHVTSDIAIGFRTNVAAAEAIKIRHARALADARPVKRDTISLADFSGGSEEFLLRDLTDIVAARLTDIFELATKALRRVGRAGLLPGGVVLAGGAADIPGIQDLARRELRLPVEVAKASAVEAFTEVVPPRLAVAAGLIAWHVERGGWSRRSSRRLGGAVEWIRRLARSFVP